MLSRDALKEFLVECHLRQLSDRTIKHERNSNNALLTFLEREYQITQIEEIRHVHLKGYIQYLIKLQRKETYINGLIKSFRAFFKYCVNEEYISVNPALKVSFQKEEIPKILTFKDDEYINGLIKSFRAFFKYCVNEEYISVNPALKVSFQKEEIPKILTFKDDEVIRMINYYKGAFFKYCVNEEYISVNPALKVSFQKEEIPKILTFKDDEVIRMINYYKGTSFLQVRNKLIMILLFDTGIRNTELCTIKMVDLRENALSIYGKGKKIRYVPITPAIEKWLMKYLIIREKYIKDKIGYSEDYLFLSQKGKPLTKETIERVVKDCKKWLMKYLIIREKYIKDKIGYSEDYLFLSQKGKPLTKETIERVVKDCKVPCGIRKEIRCSPHTCRHYYAQKQLKNGCDVYTVSRILGHTNITITKRYLESIQDEDISPHTCRHYYAQKQLKNGCDVYTVSRILGHTNITITKRYLESIQDEDILELGCKTSPLISLKIR